MRECGAVCDYSAETGSLPGNRKYSKNIIFSAAYSTTPLDVKSNKITKKGSPNPDPEAWEGYYKSRAFERMTVHNNDKKLKESLKHQVRPLHLSNLCEEGSITS